jgi:hypothetical protein
LPRQLVRISGAFRGEPLHRYSRCAHDERVLTALRKRQRALARQCGPICGDIISGYTFGDEAFDFVFRRGGRLRIAVCNGLATATVVAPGQAAGATPPSGMFPARGGAGDRLESVCALLFLAPQSRRPAKKPKRKRPPQPGEEPGRIPNQRDYESVWRRHDLPRRLFGRRLLGMRAEPISVRLLIEDMPGSIRFSPLREQRGRWLLWWCEDDVRAAPGLGGERGEHSP